MRALYTHPPPVAHAVTKPRGAYLMGRGHAAPPVAPGAMRMSDLDKEALLRLEVLPDEECKDLFAIGAFIDAENRRFLEHVSKHGLERANTTRSEADFLRNILHQRARLSQTNMVMATTYQNYLIIQTMYLNVTRRKNEALVFVACFYNSLTDDEFASTGASVDKNALRFLEGKTPGEILSMSDSELGALATTVVKSLGGSFIDDVTQKQLEGAALGDTSVWKLFFKIVIALMAVFSAMPTFVAVGVAAAQAGSPVEWTIHGSVEKAEFYSDNPKLILKTGSDAQMVSGRQFDHTKLAPAKQITDTFREIKKRNAVLDTREKEAIDKAVNTGVSFFTKSFAVLPDAATRAKSWWNNENVNSGVATWEDTFNTLMYSSWNQISQLSESAKDISMDALAETRPFIIQLVMFSICNGVKINARHRRAGYGPAVVLPVVPNPLPGLDAVLGTRIPYIKDPAIFAGKWGPQPGMLKANIEWWEKFFVFYVAKTSEVELYFKRHAMKGNLQKVLPFAKGLMYLDAKQRMLQAVTNGTADVLGFHSDLAVHEFARGFDEAAIRAGYEYAYKNKKQGGSDTIVGRWDQIQNNKKRIKQWIIHMDMIMSDCVNVNGNTYATNMAAITANANVNQGAYKYNSIDPSERAVKLKSELKIHLGIGDDQVSNVLGSNIDLALYDFETSAEYVADVDATLKKYKKAKKSNSENNIYDLTIFNVFGLNQLSQNLHDLAEGDPLSIGGLVCWYAIFVYCMYGSLRNHWSFTEWAYRQWTGIIEDEANAEMGYLTLTETLDLTKITTIEQLRIKKQQLQKGMLNLLGMSSFGKYWQSRGLQQSQLQIEDLHSGKADKNPPLPAPTNGDSDDEITTIY